MMPSLVHLVQPPLQHDGVLLRGQGAEQAAPRAGERCVHIAMSLDFGLEVLEQ